MATRAAVMARERAEIRMIKACTCGLKDDTKDQPIHTPTYCGPDRRTSNEHRYGVMGSICDVTYNVLRTYHF